MKRVISTSPLKDKTPLQRQEELSGAFLFDKNLDSRKDIAEISRILVVDDIFTTGATAGEVSNTLLEAGVMDITILTIGR